MNSTSAKCYSYGKIKYRKSHFLIRNFEVAAANMFKLTKHLNNILNTLTQEQNKRWPLWAHRLTAMGLVTTLCGFFLIKQNLSWLNILNVGLWTFSFGFWLTLINSSPFLIKTWNEWLISLGMGCFIISLYLPAFSVPNPVNGFEDISSATCFFLGWVPKFHTIFWIANPLIFASWLFIRLKRFSAAKYIIFLAIILQLSFAIFKFPVEVLQSMEGQGYYHRIPTKLKIGYWLWVLSSLCTLGGILSFKQRKPIGKISG